MIQVPVEGGELHCRVWGDDGPVVLAAHGITASHVEWGLVGEALAGEVRLVAPDLRGRGASNGLPGPYGMGRHADDLMSVLDHVGQERAVIVGHSMGAYVATATAARHPDRVAAAVLVDGALPLPLPEGLTVDQALELVIGPAMARLSMTFESREAYRDFWRVHPAFAEWTPLVEAYVDYDLVGEEPELRSRVNADAVRGDSADTLTPGVVADALLRTQCPAVLIRAETGMLAAPPALFPDEVVAEWVQRLPTLEDRGAVPGTNHYTAVVGEAGAKVVAEAVREQVAAA